MKLQFHDFPRKCQFPLLFALGSLPLTLCVFGAMEPGNIGFSFVFAGIYVLFALLAMILPGALRFFVGAAGIAALAALGYGSLCGLVCTAFWSILLLCSLRIGAWAWDDEISLQGHLLGLAVYILCHVVPLFMESLGQQILSAASGYMAVCFWVYTLLVMLSMNRDSLFFANKGKSRTSRGMHRKNTVMVAVFFLVSTALSLVPAAAAIVRAFLKWLYDLIFNDPDELEPVNPNAPIDPEGGGVIEDAPPAADRTALDEEMMVRYAKIMMGAILLLALCVLIWEVRKHLPEIRRALARYFSSATEDYTDEVTDLRDTETKTNSLLQRLQALGRDRETGDLTPQQRVRRRYKKLRRRHREWVPGATARETLPDQAASVYERTRYSDHPITRQEADSFLDATKKI